MINLHGMVRGAINSLHPEAGATLYQSVGQAADAGGQAKSVYAPGVAVAVQMQSESPTALFHADRVGMEEVSRKFYLFSAQEPERRVAGIFRPLSRGGDMFQLDDGPPGQGTWWLVDAVIEDFTRSGWVCVRATMQVRPPDFTYSDWWRQRPPCSETTEGV